MSSPPQVFHIAGWSSCGYYSRASSVLTSMSILFPTKVKVVQHPFPNRNEYRSWLVDSGFRTAIKDERAHKHSSSPFTWVGCEGSGGSSTTTPPSAEDVKEYIGGHDDTLEYFRTFCQPDERGANTNSYETMKPDGYEPSHGYDYDLIVIGGGSGGLACSKEAAAHGAKVAVCDFVKPSPHGTSWGLGGTCVNVGCIPKKLMHQASLVNEAMILDSPAFGIGTVGTDAMENGGGDITKATVTKHDWDTLRENVNNHIRGLNFKYRVNLREQKVRYLNALAKFIDPHTLELTDKKGKVSQVTSARFVVAVGGRPTPLDCEGSDLAISSDDIFSHPSNPGKVLCVGASYISLECAGFLAGLGHDVTVAVRSILLRGFDRECAEKIGSYMEDHGVVFRRKVVPKKLEKVTEEDGKERIRVTFSDDTTEVYDTVLGAIGRTGDTSKLGLENVGIQVTRNAKLEAKYEQTSVPNIYAIGDAVDGVAELTPVAIQSGVLLAKRLFTKSKLLMDYRNVCTVVFTPVEFGTVGYMEDEAMEEFGEDVIDVYHKSFYPLEWAMVPGRQSHKAFTKVIVERGGKQKVLGIQYLGPNAGEVMQGYGVAMKKGLTFQDLEDTVGIHPTVAEEIVTLKVTKRSGADASSGGC